jgi:Asp-tRNA(Asn)/Glu-tRNA(Gln) amidotransferase A subunit family amidase
MTGDLSHLMARELAPRLASGDVRAADVASACLARVDASENTVHAWAHIDPDAVAAQAAALDARFAESGPVGPLHGIPVGLKDVIDTADMPTENGTAADAGRRPEADAALVTALRNAGAIVMGKTVTAELAHREPGPTANPLDPSRTPGGSSSGSAAEVAAEMTPLAVGTQTGGSVVRPAAYCGIVGYKPTVGLIPTAGVFCRSHTLDTMGVFARTVADAALLADCLAGGAGLSPVADKSGFSLAFAHPPGWERCDDDMKAALEELQGELGARAESVKLPACFDDAAAAHRVVSLVELSKYAASYAEKHAEDISEGMLQDIETGAGFSAVAYLRALDMVGVLNDALEPVFGKYDAIVTPSALGQAPVGLANTGEAIFCSLWTLCGTPTISLPLLTGADGMPLGVQLIGRRGADADLLATATALTASLDES